MYKILQFPVFWFKHPTPLTPLGQVLQAQLTLLVHLGQQPLLEGVQRGGGEEPARLQSAVQATVLHQVQDEGLGLCLGAAQGVGRWRALQAHGWFRGAALASTLVLVALLTWWILGR